MYKNNTFAITLMPFLCVMLARPSATGGLIIEQHRIY